ncbi:MAG: hypothetical protein C0467_16120 [Planctomycetaceae bacterium]|nr:hypothetical protein [Planctomycetaceae bacterium]
MFATNLRYHRERAKLSQAELADKTGTSLARILSLEGGEADPEWREVVAIADTLTIPIDSLRNLPARAMPVTLPRFDERVNEIDDPRKVYIGEQTRNARPWPPSSNSQDSIVLRRARDFPASPVCVADALTLKAGLLSKRAESDEESFLLGLTSYWAGEYEEAAGHFRDAIKQGSRFKREAKPFRDLSEGLAEGLAKAKKQAEGRPGQAEFRARLLKAYEHKCAISDWNGDGALEAAHIIPFKQSLSQNIQNGILLRADIHRLFDLLLIRLRPDAPDHLTVVIDPSLHNTPYMTFANKRVRLPEASLHRPDWGNVQRRWGACPTFSSPL